MGHETLYVSFASFASPKGRVTDEGADPPGFRALEISLPSGFDKDNLLRRGLQSRDYARRARALVRGERPDVVISANAPIEVQEALGKATAAQGGAFVFWVQDIHSDAIEMILGRRNRLLGWAAGQYYRSHEVGTLRRSAAIVAIADAFRDRLADWGIDPARVAVIENWGAIGDIPRGSRDNAWASAHMAGTGRPRIVYSGTLARKHNPDLLLHLARNLDADVFLFSEGRNADYVRETAVAEGLGNLFVRPWVSIDDLPDMLAGADILFAVIETDAARFSVPSKVLSYLSAGRPILASIPADNLSGKNIVRAGAGLISAPGDVEALLGNARALLADATLRRRMGDAGRAYAEQKFDITSVGAQFLAIFEAAAIRVGRLPGQEASAPVPALDADVSS